jgi:aerotaxis receptor
VITYCNDEFINISGFERSELVGKSHNACVTSVTVAQKVVGYESVRVSPKPEDVKRANNYYTRLNAVKKSMPKVPQSAFSSVLFLALLVSSFFVFKENWSLLCLAVLVEVCTFFGISALLIQKNLVVD